MKKQKSESMFLMLLITFSGGLQDAYSYWVRGKVFANAQTGNIVLLAQAVFEKQVSLGLKYLFPVLAFLLGIFLSEWFRVKLKYNTKIHWRQVVLLIECVLLTLVAFIPLSLTWNPLANALISFSCAMQVQAFRSVQKHPYASTMCIGNMRSGMEALVHYVADKHIQKLQSALLYFMVIGVFFIGAGLGHFLLKHTLFNRYPAFLILISCFFLSFAFIFMIEREIK